MRDAGTELKWNLKGGRKVERLTPLRAIREKCLMCKKTTEKVMRCKETECPLHDFRFGKNPAKAHPCDKAY